MFRIAFTFLAVGALVFIAASILWPMGERGEESTAVPYELVSLSRGSITEVVSSTGTLSPVDTVQVGSQVSGTIQHLYVDFNDHVDTGQLIAQIDPSIFQAKLAEAEANLLSAEAQTEKATVAVAEAKRELDRVAEVHRKKLASASELDTVRFTYELAQVERRVKDAAVAQARAALLRERVNLEYTAIYAPTDGVIISRDVNVGQTVAASLQAPTLYTIAKDLTRMQVEADVDESFIGKVREGQAVVFTVFAYPGREFAGEVAQVRLQPKVDAGVVKYNCVIRVDNSDLALKPGMTATVLIAVERHEEAWQVPHVALRFVPDLPKSQLERARSGLRPGDGVVWLPDNNVLKPLTVTTGIVGEKLTEISAPGLSAEMRVAVPGPRKETPRRRRFGLSLF